MRRARSQNTAGDVCGSAALCSQLRADNGSTNPAGEKDFGLSGGASERRRAPRRCGVGLRVLRCARGAKEAVFNAAPSSKQSVRSPLEDMGAFFLSSAWGEMVFIAWGEPRCGCEFEGGSL